MFDAVMVSPTTVEVTAKEKTALGIESQEAAF